MVSDVVYYPAGFAHRAHFLKGDMLFRISQL